MQENRRNLRLLSCGDSPFKYDLGSEDAEGNQDSTISVFTRDADGSVRHFYTAHPGMSEEIDQRGVDLLCAVWHFLDLTPQGRDDWYLDLKYPSDHPPGGRPFLTDSTAHSDTARGSQSQRPEISEECSISVKVRRFSASCWPGADCQIFLTVNTYEVC